MGVGERGIELDRAPIALGRLVPGGALDVELAAAHEPLARRVEGVLAAAPRRERLHGARGRAADEREHELAVGLHPRAVAMEQQAVRVRPRAQARERLALGEALAHRVGAAADPAQRHAALEQPDDRAHRHEVAKTKRGLRGDFRRRADQGGAFPITHPPTRNPADTGDVAQGVRGHRAGKYTDALVPQGWRYNERMAHPFRFGVQLENLPPHEWREQIQRIESLGYSSVFWPDHFHTQWEPVTALAAAAAVTTRLAIGSLVYDVDYRHPVVLAKAAATLQLLSGGRHEFGIGAGWMETDYREAGLPYDRPAVRIARLAEALEILRADVDAGTHELLRRALPDRQHRQGRRSAARDAAEAPDRRRRAQGARSRGAHRGHHRHQSEHPEGRRARRHAGRSLARARRREGALGARGSRRGGTPDLEAIELTTLSFVVAITDDPKPLREALARNSPMSVEQVADCPLFITGSAAEIRDTLERRRDRTGISYVVIQGKDPALLESFAEAVVAPLAGR